MATESKRVLVFGATGEMGGRVARACADAGHRVTGVSRGRNTAGTVSLEGVEMLTGDKGEPSCHTSVLAGREFDTIVDIVPTTEHTRLAFEQWGGRIEHYILCSSTGTYAPLQYLPADEDHPWQEETRVNFWHQCKRDMVALDLWREHGFPATILRPTNIIGRHRIPLELWGGRNILFFRLLQQGKPVEIPVQGTVLLQSGHNDDLATAFAHAVGKDREIAGEIFNISSKKAITLERYLAVAKEILGSASDVERLPIDAIHRRRPEDTDIGGLRFLVEHMCFDMGKAERVLGYNPRYSPEQGLEHALAWCFDTGLLRKGRP